MRLGLLPLLLCLTLPFTAPAAATGAPSPASASSLAPTLMFDIDDTIMKLPTLNYVFRKGGADERALTSHELREIRQQLGLPGTPWADWELRYGPGGSYRRSGDGPVNYFREDIEKALTLPPSEWQGPAWDEFTHALRDCRSARRAGVITAREHSPAVMMAGLRVLKRRGLIGCLPPAGNLRAVNHADTNPGKRHTVEEAKAQVVLKDLDRLQGARAAGAEPAVYYFTDDDPANLQRITQRLAAEGDRWPGVDVYLRRAGGSGDGEILRVHRGRVLKSSLANLERAAHLPAGIPVGIPCGPDLSHRSVLNATLPR